MFPPPARSSRQFPAHRQGRPSAALARAGGLPDTSGRHAALRGSVPVLRNPHPSPTSRPGASFARPQFSTSPTAQRRDCAVWSRRNSPVGAFGIRTIALDFGHIKTTRRGSHPCANSFLFPFFCCRLRAACPTPFRVAARARLSARCWRTRRTATWLQARRLVRWLARQPAVSTSGCRPAARAIDLTSAFGRPHHPSTAILGIPPGVAVSVSAPCRA